MAELTEEDLKNMNPEEMAELQKKNCVFCKIIKGDVPSHKVHSDDKMLAILDIYPSTKGHILVLPKEHTPIMPLLPPDTFKHMFRKVKFLTKGVKEGLPSTKTTIFIANGGVAGQQSPHFLFHIIPRDDGDKLSKFEIPENNVSQDDILEPLKNNFQKMMQSHFQKEGKMLVQPPEKTELAKILETNPQLKELVINKPEQLKKEIESNAQLKVLFQGIDIDKLSDQLKKIGTSEEQTVETPELEIEDKEVAEEEPQKEEEKESETAEDEKPKSEEKDKPEGGLLDRISDMFK